MPRDDDRAARELREVRIERGVTPAAGSVIYRSGRTAVLCTAISEESVPRWMEGRGGGWLTATYEMLPASTPMRKARKATPDGRSVEIQRLIGRSLRAAVDLEALGPRTISIDCHVLWADAGTRTAAINGGYVALCDLIADLVDRRVITESPIKRSIQAVSVGLLAGEPTLDLCYKEDAGADVDLNVVAANAEDLVEVQGTAEGKPFSREQLDTLVELAMKGMAEIRIAQEQALTEGRS